MKFMLKRLFIATLAALVIVAGCDKPETETQDGPAAKSDLVGSWESHGETVFVFNADGTYTETQWGGNVSGKWDFNDGKLTCTPTGGEAWEVGIKLIGGKAWLVFVYEGEGYRSIENYRKVGATVKSGKLTDGRWDSTHSGVKPKEFTPATDYVFNMIIKGDKVDLYVPMWGYHIQGTFTLENGRMKIETDDDHIWAGKYYEITDDLNWYIGWNAWGSPIDDDPNWDESYGAMNAETFELQSPYSYYTVTQLLSMGENPKEHPTEYAADPSQFKFIVYELGEQLREEARDLCDFDLCVTADGKEAYGGAVGRSAWMYRR